MGKAERAHLDFVMGTGICLLPILLSYILFILVPKCEQLQLWLHLRAI